MFLLLRSRKSFASVLTGCGALGAAVVLAAPAASADVTGVTVAAGMSFGSSTSYGTNCTYTTTATAAPGDTVGFFDPLGTFEPSGWLTVGDSGQVTAQWKPTFPGQHNVYAVRNNGTYVSTVVTVGNGTNLGPACLVL